MKKNLLIVILTFIAVPLAFAQPRQAAAAPSAGGKIGASPNGLYKHIGIAGQAGSSAHTTFANGMSGNFGLLNASQLENEFDTLDFVTALNLGGKGADLIADVAIGEKKNVYITGSFKNRDVDFNPYGTPYLLSSGGIADIFIAKYNPCNELIWAFSIGGGSDDIGLAIDLDAAGNVYVAGYFGSADVDFDPGAGTNNLSAQGQTDGFLAKYDSNGNWQWAFNTGGNIAKQDFWAGITVDAAGSVYASGFMYGSIDLDPGPGTTTINADNDFANGVLAKYSTNGSFEWGFKVGNNDTNRFHGTAIDSEGNIIVTGFGKSGGLDFDPLGPTTTSLNAAGDSDAILAKYNGSNGHLIWVHLLGDASGDIGSQVSVDAQDNIYLAGYFLGTLDLDPGAGVNLQSSAGEADVFLAKFDKGGNHIWGHKIGGSGSDSGGAITVGEEYVYIGGNFAGTNVDFDPGPGEFNLSSNGGGDAFVAQFRLDGRFLDAFHIGGDNNDDLKNLDYKQGVLGLAGHFAGQAVDFDPSEDNVFSLSVPSESRRDDGFLHSMAWKVGALLTPPSRPP